MVDINIKLLILVMLAGLCATETVYAAVALEQLEGNLAEISKNSLYKYFTAETVEKIKKATEELQELIKKPKNTWPKFEDLINSYNTFLASEVIEDLKKLNWPAQKDQYSMYEQEVLANLGDLSYQLKFKEHYERIAAQVSTP